MPEPAAWPTTARERGEVVRAGGHGFLIDDAGGAFWQGREGLSAVLRQADERQPETPLAAALYAAIGSRAWPDIRAHVYAGGRAAVARLAPARVRGSPGRRPRRPAYSAAGRGGTGAAGPGGAGAHRWHPLAAAGGAINPLVLAALRGSLGASAEFRPGVSPLLGGPALARQLGPRREEVAG